MNTIKNVPGYVVYQTLNGFWKWESILSPESHSCGGFSSYEDALYSCHVANESWEDYASNNVYFK